MKKYFTLLCSILLSISVVSNVCSCKENEDDIIPEVSSNDNAMLVGTWKEPYAKFVFNSDGTSIVTIEDEDPVKGTYRYNNSTHKLFIKFVDEEEIATFTVTFFSPNKIRLQVDDSYEDDYFDLTRVS